MARAAARYVDGFVIPLPRKNLSAYRRMAVACSRIWRDHGALEFRECVGDDMKASVGMPFPKLLKLKPGETAMFSWITFKSRAHRDAVNDKVMKDPRLAKMMTEKMPFDCTRMAYGGFKILVNA